MTTRDHDGTAGPHIIAEVGGLVDETHVMLGIYGHDLQPEEISIVLGCSATSGHRRGDTRGSGPPFTQGAWILKVEGKAPVEPDKLVQGLLSRVLIEPITWEQLVAKYRIRLSFTLFVGAWTRGFELSPTTVERLARLGIVIGFSIYADDGEENV